MQFVSFKTDVRGVTYTMKTPDGKVQSRTEHIPVALGCCPKCDAVLFHYDGVLGEQLHRVARKQLGDALAYCPRCGENYGIGDIIDGECEVIKVEDSDDSSGENADTTTKD